MRFNYSLIKKFAICLLVVLCLLLVATPVLAIANPDNIWFGTTADKYVRVFENVYETGDMLFLAEGFVDYASAPTDYTASEAFLFEVRSTDNTTVIRSRPLESYGDRPISIYFTPAQVVSEGLASGSAYVMRITGNPMIFSTLTEGTNMISYTLASEDWYNQALSTEVTNYLKNMCIAIAYRMETEDSVAAGTYVAVSDGEDYLTTTGANLFLAGIPSLNIFVPSLFQITTSVMVAEEPAATGAYTANITPLLRLGTTISTGISHIGEWLGVSQAVAAGLMLMSLMVMLSVWLYKKTESGKVVLGVGIAATLPVGTFLGLSPMVLLFIIVIFIALLMGYYFLTRGAL